MLVFIERMRNQKVEIILDGYQSRVSVHKYQFIGINWINCYRLIYIIYVSVPKGILQ